MIQIIVVAVGGAIGAVLRYSTGLLALKYLSNSRVCTGTLISNIIGCFLTGIVLFLFSHSEITSENIVIFLTVGILGSYTTFSTFALETGKLLSRPVLPLLYYLFWQIFGAFTALAAGYGLASVIAGGG